MDLRLARLECDALGTDSFEVKSLVGVDEFNRLFSYMFRVDLIDPRIFHGRESRLLASGATLVFEEGGEPVARIHGIFSELAHEHSASGEGAGLLLTLVPRAWALTRSHATEIFLDRTVPQIITEKLQRLGFQEGRDFSLVLRSRYPVREFVVQYGESDLQFVSRLCEHLGIFFFFRHVEGRDVITFGDTVDILQPIERPSGTVSFHRAADKNSAFEARSTWRRVSEQAVVHDYNYRAPRLALTSAKPSGGQVADGSIVEYGVHSKTPEETDHIGRVRAEEIAAGQHIVTGKTRDMTLHVGRTFVLVDEFGAEQPLTLTKVTIRSHAEGEALRSSERSWHNEFVAIPGGVPYRPPRNTPKPKISGLIHAVVDGAVKGPYAELDEAGRYRVRFAYDRSGRGDLQATRPLRMLQPHGGAKYGMHFPLRHGTEVLVGFVEGDPDRPVIVGAIPNPETPSPVDLANQTQNVLRTASFNEMVIEDLHGQERIRVHSPRHDTTVQLGSEEEPEEGALTSTEANISQASRLSNNEATARKVIVSGNTSALVGDSVVTLAGLDGILPAVAAGIERLAAVSGQQRAIEGDIQRLAAPPGEETEPPADQPPEVVPLEGMSLPAGRWSDLAEQLAASAHEGAMLALARMAESTDLNADESIGRLSGEPMGQPTRPSFVAGSRSTAGLFGRERAIVFGERIAALSSEDTVTVVGKKVAQLKSPGAAELAAGTAAKVTSAGELDMAAATIRLVGGYYPAQEAPPLDENTSVGMMARHEMRLVSTEDCILACAAKNVIAAAHTGEMRLSAKRSVIVTGGSVSCSGSPITLSSGGDIKLDAKATVDIHGATVKVKADGAVEIEGATVTIKGPIKLDGNVTVTADLTVNGSINGG